MDDFSRYTKLRDLGYSAVYVARIAREDGLDEIVVRIRMLRSIFAPLSLEQAKETKIIADGLANSLSEYQEQVILPVLEQVQKELKLNGERESG